MRRMLSRGPARKTRERLKWSLCVALATLSLSWGTGGCLSDVQIPQCMLDNVECGAASGAPSVGEGGAGNDAGVVSHSGEGGHANDAGATSLAGPGGVGSAPAVPPNEAGAAGASEPPDLKISPDKLERPCASHRYEAKLKVEGGRAPYEWRLAPERAGWSLEADPTSTERALLRSEQVSAGEITLSVTATDADGISKVVDFDLLARSSCWFAYTALVADEPTLQLLDPLIQPAVAAELEHNSGVYDFQFSPDGRYLVYRFGRDDSAPKGRHLSLVDLVTLDEEVLDLGEDSITAFAWSADGSRLAVGFRVGDATHLNAVRMPAVGSDASVQPLAAVPGFVESDLAWVGNQYVAFQAEVLPDFEHPGEFLPNPTRIHTAFYAKLAEAGFDQPQLADGLFAPETMLRATSLGFFMISGVNPRTYFYVLGDEALPVDNTLTRLVSPSGLYTAVLDEQRLRVARAELSSLDIFARAREDGGDAEVPQNCPTLLAWSASDERLACVADIPNPDGQTTHGEVRVFKLIEGVTPWTGSEDEGRLEMSSLAGFCDDDTSSSELGSCGAAAQKYAYGSEQARHHARGFSPSGQWFAFSKVEVKVKSGVESAHTHLYWADVQASPPKFIKPAFFVDADSSTVTRLAFAPDERFFAFQRGPVLRLQDVNSETFWTLSTTLDFDRVCSEEFPAAPLEFCGNTDAFGQLQWSPASQAFAFRDARGMIAYDVAALPISSPLVLPGKECDVRCSNRFSFQPLSDP
jgi:hypothetical protein